MSRWIVLVLGLWLAGARAQEVSAPEAAAVKAIVEAQLAAFAADDAEAAFALASVGIQEKFGDAKTFLNMVRTNYPAVYRPASVVFMPPERNREGITQHVQFADRDNSLWLARYLIIRAPDERWRIHGCVIQKVLGSGTALLWGNTNHVL